MVRAGVHIGSLVPLNRCIGKADLRRLMLLRLQLLCPCDVGVGGGALRGVRGLRALPNRTQPTFSPQPLTWGTSCLTAPPPCRSALVSGLPHRPEPWGSPAFLHT